MSKSNPTTIVYTNSTLGELYNKIIDSMVNVENAEVEYDKRVAMYNYKEDIKPTWFGFGKPKFEGTFDEYYENKWGTLNMNSLYKNVRSLRRLQGIHDIVAESIQKGNDLHLSLFDHKFINVCRNENVTSIEAYNASF